MSMKCLTVVMLALCVTAEPTRATFLRKPSDSSVPLRLQQSITLSEDTAKAVLQDLSLLKLLETQQVSDQDKEQIRKVAAEDRAKLTAASEALIEVIHEVEQGNMRSEVSLLYRAANENAKKLAQVSEELALIEKALQPEAKEVKAAETKEHDSKESESAQVVIPLKAIVLSAPSVDQMLQIAVCLETLLRAHKSSNDILDAIDNEQHSIEEQQAVLNQRKQTLRSVVSTRADALQRHRDLVTEAKEKVAKALEALQESQQLLEEKARVIEDLEKRVLA